VFLDLSGEVVEKTLAPGERLRVHAGHIGMQEESVTVEIKMVRGFRNILCAGEGLFLASLAGPGKVWLQTMPILNLAEEIARHLPDHQAESAAVGAGVGRAVAGSGAGILLGGLLGGLLGRND
jgi:uncharacterized protein (AIM24 family)